MKTYSVTYRRDLGNDASLVEVGEMPDVCTYGRTLEEAAVNAREAVAVFDAERDPVDGEGVSVAVVPADGVEQLVCVATAYRDGQVLDVIGRPDRGALEIRLDE